jgi:demethylmenaquinone methyltransferase / 2-methoxy-6-polyprenyl-1,4-benzoquinol methylase
VSTQAVRQGSGQMFDAIAGRYDLVNRLISLGIDQSWRERTVRSLELSNDARVLDIATGTADLAIMIAKSEGSSRVIGLDPSEKMLEVGRAKIAHEGLGARVTLQAGDAERLPFGDRSFDGVTIAFGIRNVPDRERALAEMARVTKLGGRVAILELSEPRAGLLGRLARFHVHTVVPTVGALLSGAPEYAYLQRSIAAFPPAEEFVAKMERAGLSLIECAPLTFGVCHLYLAQPRESV